MPRRTADAAGRRWRPRVVALGPLALALACYGRPDTLGRPCREDGDCDDGQRCLDQRCVLPEPGPTDADGSGERGASSDDTSDDTSGTSDGTGDGTSDDTSDGGDRDPGGDTSTSGTGEMSETTGRQVVRATPSASGAASSCMGCGSSTTLLDPAVIL